MSGAGSVGAGAGGLMMMGGGNPIPQQQEQQRQPVAGAGVARRLPRGGDNENAPQDRAKANNTKYYLRTSVDVATLRKPIRDSDDNKKGAMLANYVPKVVNLVSVWAAPLLVRLPVRCSSGSCSRSCFG